MTKAGNCVVATSIIIVLFLCTSSDTVEFRLIRTLVIDPTISYS